MPPIGDLDGVAVAEANEDFTERTISLPPSMAPRPQVEGTAHLLLVLVENAAPRHVLLNPLPLTIGRSSPAEVILEGGTVRGAIACSSGAATES